MDCGKNILGEGVGGWYQEDQTVLGLPVGDPSALSVDLNKNIAIFQYQFEILVKSLQNFYTKSIHTDSEAIL